MSLLFPRFAYAPAHCGPARRQDVAPFFNLFDDTIKEIQRASRQESKQWTPRFDVRETKDAFNLEAEVPGVEQENLSIEFTDEHTLTVKGRSERSVEKGKKSESETPTTTEDGTATPSSEKSHQATVEDEEPANASAATEVAAPAPAAEVTKPAAEPKEQYWYSERRVGEFARSFKFASRVDQEAVKASLKNGVLSIVVPKAAAPESRRINIE